MKQNNNYKIVEIDENDYWSFKSRIINFRIIYHIKDPIDVIAMAPYDLEPNGRTPSAGTVLTIKLDLFSITSLWLWRFGINFRSADVIIQNGRSRKISRHFEY